MLYIVKFTFNDSYRPKAEGFQHVSLVVDSPDKFTAMHAAWSRLKPLQDVSWFPMGEPESFECVKVSKD